MKTNRRTLLMGAAALGLAAWAFSPSQLLIVALSAYFFVLLVRFWAPRVDAALTWRIR